MDKFYLKAAITLKYAPNNIYLCASEDDGRFSDRGKPMKIRFWPKSNEGKKTAQGTVAHKSRQTTAACKKGDIVYSYMLL